MDTEAYYAKKQIARRQMEVLAFILAVCQHQFSVRVWLHIAIVDTRVLVLPVLVLCLKLP
jgi:hypothetical protein